MFLRLAIALFVALITSGFYSAYAFDKGIYHFDFVSIAAFSLAGIITVLLGDLSYARSFIPAAKTKKSAQNIAELPREEGTVKWFNVSKGFGFITRPNGEDIFVHYRSIRGHGRRRLFDGQVVSFVIIDSDKGIQADDIDIIK